MPGAGQMSVSPSSAPSSAMPWRSSHSPIEASAASSFARRWPRRRPSRARRRRRGGRRRAGGRIRRRRPPSHTRRGARCRGRRTRAAARASADAPSIASRIRRPSGCRAGDPRRTRARAPTPPRRAPRSAAPSRRVRRGAAPRDRAGAAPSSALFTSCSTRVGGERRLERGSGEEGRLALVGHLGGTRRSTPAGLPGVEGSTGGAPARRSEPRARALARSRSPPRPSPRTGPPAKHSRARRGA